MRFSKRQNLQELYSFNCLLATSTYLKTFVPTWYWCEWRPFRHIEVLIILQFSHAWDELVTLNSSKHKMLGLLSIVLCLERHLVSVGVLLERSCDILAMFVYIMTCVRKQVRQSLLLCILNSCFIWCNHCQIQYCTWRFSGHAYFSCNKHLHVCWCQWQCLLRNVYEECWIQCLE